MGHTTSILLDYTLFYKNLFNKNRQGSFSQVLRISLESCRGSIKTTKIYFAKFNMVTLCFLILPMCYSTKQTEKRLVAGLYHIKMYHLSNNQPGLKNLKRFLSKKEV